MLSFIIYVLNAEEEITVENLKAKLMNKMLGTQNIQQRLSG